jgi:holdfast attachment protein HfaA
MVATRNFQSLRIGAIGLATMLAALTASAASAQSNNGAAFNAGYGRSSTSATNYGVNAGTRDASGNRIIIDGIIQGGLDQSSISRTSADASTGVGYGGSTAIGNNLTVITQGNWNTVIVNSTQTNTGDVSATTNMSGVGSTDGN